MARLCHSGDAGGVWHTPLGRAVRQGLCVLAWGLWCTGVGAAGGADSFVLVVRSESSPPYQEAAEALRNEVHRDIEVLDLSQYSAQGAAASKASSSNSSPPRVIVALGTPACAQAARSAGPSAVLCTLLPRSSFERVLHDTGRRAGGAISAIYLNQPYTRQIDLIRLALPQAKQIGVVWSAETAAAESGLESVVHARGLQLLSATMRADEPVFNAFKRVLGDADVLLALADSQVYNSASIQNILLTSFRAQVPMVAFSPAYGRAGALLALYATPSQLGQQAGVWAKAVVQGQALPMPAHPQAFEISVNDNVARSLGLKVDAGELTERLRRLEQGP